MNNNISEILHQNSHKNPTKLHWNMYNENTMLATLHVNISSVHLKEMKSKNIKKKKMVIQWKISEQQPVLLITNTEKLSHEGSIQWSYDEIFLAEVFEKLFGDFQEDIFGSSQPDLVNSSLCLWHSNLQSSAEWFCVRFECRWRHEYTLL